MTPPYNYYHTLYLYVLQAKSSPFTFCLDTLYNLFTQICQIAV